MMQMENNNTNSSNSETDSKNEFPKMTEEKYDVACLRLFGRYGHVHVTSENLQTVDPDVRNVEVVLSDESELCPQCWDEQKLTTMPQILQEAEEVWTICKIVSRRIDDEDGLSAPSLVP
jgi:hypothetical protein